MEQGAFAHSTVVSAGQDVERSATDKAALDDAATRLLTAPPQLPSVAAAIEGHRAAREALGVLCPAQDKVAVRAAGGDTSDEAMAHARAAWKAADEAEHAAMGRLLAVRPADPSELAQILRYLAGSSARDDILVDVDFANDLAEMAEAVAASHGTAKTNDPIFALIEEGLRLLAVSDAAFATGVGEDVRTEALVQLSDYCRDVLLETVPQTAAGCQELARFALEYFEHQGVSISDDEQAVTSLIARSPLLLPPSFDAPPDPVFSAIERYQAAREAGDAFSKRFEVEGAEAFGGWDVASEEDLRLAHTWSDLATEVLETAPTTEAGRLALAAFIEMWVDSHGNLDGSPQDGSETVFAEVYPALLNALRASVPTGFEPMAYVRAFPPKRATVARPPQPSPAVIPPGGLAEACDWAVWHSAWLNEATIAEGWSNDRLDAEMSKYNLVWDRAVSEPADTIQTLAAKARMLKTSWLDNKGDEERDSLDKLILSVMEDVAALSSQQSESALSSLEARS